MRSVSRRLIDRVLGMLLSLSLLLEHVSGSDRVCR